MPKGRKKKQKRVAKSRAKRGARMAARKSRKAPQDKARRNIFHGVSRTTVGTAEIYGAFVSPTIFEEGLGSVVIARKLPNGRIAFGMFLVDAYCLGVKNADFNIVPRETFNDYIDQAAGLHGLPRDDPARARKLVEEAIAYARDLGFNPHRDFRDAEAIFGDIDADECEELFVFGSNGKPFFVAGPYDSPGKIRRIMARLGEACEEDGYHTLLETDDPEGLDEIWEDGGFEDDEDDTEDEDEDVLIPFPEAIEPAQADWESLYAAAQRIKDIEPWRFMEEDDLFGVQFPGRGEIGYVSVMGLLGEHLAISVYLGADALKTFFEIHAFSPDTVTADRIFEMRQLMLSFEDREELEARDRELIRQLGLKVRGRQAWPLFRSYRPGYAPWYLDGEEVELLTVALQQTAEVVQRIKDEPDLLPWEPEAGGRCLVRTPVQSAEGSTWQDVIRFFPRSDVPAVAEAVDPATVKRFSRLKGAAADVEMDFFMYPATIGHRGKRQSLSFVLLVVETGTGAVLGVEILQALNGLDEMWREIPETAYSIFEKANVRPTWIGIAHRRLYGALAPIAEAAGLPIARCADLPSLAPARESLQEHAMR